MRGDVRIMKLNTTDADLFENQNHLIGLYNKSRLNQYDLKPEEIESLIAIAFHSKATDAIFPFPSARRSMINVLLQNPNVSPDTMKSFISLFPRPVAKNPAFLLVILERPDVIGGIFEYSTLVTVLKTVTSVEYSLSVLEVYRYIKNIESSWYVNTWTLKQVYKKVNKFQDTKRRDALLEKIQEIILLPYPKYVKKRAT
jgi:hypothetical protein